MRGISTILSAILVFVFALPAAASSAGITYQGRIMKPNGDSLEGSNVQFRIQVRTPNNSNCLMYEEVKSLDMRGSKGLFGLTINDGLGTRTDATGLGLDKVFANRVSFTFDPTTCSTGTTYNPSPDDGRKLVVFFKDETMGAWEPMPTTDVNYVPYAFDSGSVGGFNSDSLLRVLNAGSLGNVA
ncbi:MAG: hypothetical protein AAB250_19710, partial [Bdellovibrionota bacterium]